LENHVHRITPVGTWVLINEMWYKPKRKSRSPGKA